MALIYRRLLVRKEVKILVYLYQQMRDGEIQLVAGSLAFSTLLSMIPFLAVTLATFQMFGGLEFLYPKVEALLLGYLREAAGGDATRFIRKAIEKAQVNTVGNFGIVFLLVTSMRLLSDMEKGVNRLWHVKTTRPLYKRIFFYWLFIATLPVVLAFYAGIRYLDILRPLTQAVPRDLTDFLVAFSGLVVIYKFVPQAKVRWWPVLISATFAGLGVVLLGNSIRGIIFHFFNVSKIYGSFAAAPLIMIWILIVWYVVLAGVALCASLHRNRDAFTLK